MAKTTVDLPEGIHRKLRVKAALEASSMSDIVVAALERYLHNFQIESGMLEVDTVGKENQKHSVSSKEG